jgi:sec-independent protein translocase protein TatA
MYSVFLFLNLGGGEVFVVIIFIILLFGSDQLPQLLKGLGQGIREINDAKTQIQNEIKKGTGVSAEELNKHTTIIQQEISQVEQTVRRQVNSFISETPKINPEDESNLSSDDKQ